MRDGWALCLTCGRSGKVAGESLDPGRPMVRCAWVDKDKAQHGHGITLGTRSQEESDALQLAARERRQITAHNRGSHADKRSRFCPSCEAERSHQRLPISGG